MTSASDPASPAAPFVPIDGARYQRIGNLAAGTLLDILRVMHAAGGRAWGTSDAGPLVSGCVTALAEFMLEGDETATVDSVRQILLLNYDAVAPQLALALAAERAGRHAEGQA